MEKSAIRLVILDGLEAGAVGVAKREPFRSRFLAGETAAPIAELEMDSLARMELCIAIEISTGVSLAPEELERYATLGALVDDLAGRLHG